ncbi:hypothetical protein AQZ52_01825 [Novosphingobium fuchskuhlense]|uniref:Glycerophosphoryl diester phosphodiesterase membrane domain-containing protein n=1 Tax=Novosphingobium fuchskuhlense TaxID=1117702 RepID=A0A124JWV6_9SPHN|nr:hypothetical protein AQZ52_01825 [Novosphingobium fuchskuhlense]
MARTWRSAGIFLLLVQMVNYAASFALIATLGVSATFSHNIAGSISLISGVVFGFLALYLLTMAAGMAGVTGALLKADRGEDVTVGDSVTAAAQMTLPVLGLTILWFIGVYLGFILLIVPGCMLLAAWSVSVPALVAEEAGVFGAFARSRTLTKGFRFKIFLALLLAIVAMYLGFAALAFLWADALSNAGFYGAIALLVGIVAATILTLLTIQALLVAIYGELIDLKGDRVMDVFN